MNTSQQFCCTHPSGKDIYLFTLRHPGGPEVVITNFGAIIVSFKVKDKQGQVNDIVLGFDNPADYSGAQYLEHYPWFGAAIGRYANRIGFSHYEYNGTAYTLSRNRGRHNLHGGTEGFDKKVWELVSFGDSPAPYLELQYNSPDGEEGFPGNLETKIRFELGAENELTYSFTAHTDQATPVNLTHHGYFNLDNGEGRIMDHELRIPASAYLEQDRDLVATGKEIDVTGSPHDFRTFKKIGEGLLKVPEFDQSFVIDPQENGLVAEARSTRSGLHLQVFSTEPIVHFYSGKWTPEVPGKNGITYGPFSGFCLETHSHPNAVNIPHFPDTILLPGETYQQETKYKVLIW